MSYSTVKEFAKAFESVAKLAPEQQKAALGAFNSMKKENPEMKDSAVVSAVLKDMEGEKMDETFHSINLIELAEESETTEIEILRVGTIQDRGLEITKKMLSDLVKNYEEDVYGVQLQVNKSHYREGEATGWFQGLRVAGDRLMAKIKWNPLGKELLQNEIFKYVSAEFGKIKHHQTGKIVDNVLIGLALTNIPAMKGQSPIVLSDQITLNSHNNMDKFKTILSELSERAFATSLEKKMLQEAFQELSEEEQAEVKAEVESVEAKPEEAPQEEEKKEEKEPEQKGGEEKKEEEGTEALTEQLTETQKQNQELSERVQKLEEEKLATELDSKFEKELMLSEDNPIGFTAKSKEAVLEYLTGQSPEAREKFTQLFSEIRAADLSERGKEVDSEKGAVEKDEAMAKAEELAEKSGRPVHKHLAEIYAAQDQEAK